MITKSCADPFLFVGCTILALVAQSAPAFQPKPKPRDDGHIPGSLVDLLDQDGWEQPPAPMDPAAPLAPPAIPFNQTPEPEPSTEPRPVAKQGPVAPAPNVVAQIDQLIAARHALVDGCNFFQLIDQFLKAQQRAAVAQARVVQINLAANRASADINIARVQQNDAMARQAEANLSEARRQMAQAQPELNEALQRLQAAWGQLEPNIAKFLKLYRDMRQFVAYDRTSPRLAATRDALNRSCGQRADFHEGRVLAAVCEAYAGNAESAKQHLQKGAFFGQEIFFSWPPANDMVLAYLLLGQPDAVDNWVKWVRDIDEKRKTPTRCWLVALQGAIECKDNQAAEWFKRCERRINSTANKAGQPPIIPVEVAGEWAFFLTTCNNQQLRDLPKAKELLDGRGVESSWYVARAVAAMAAAEDRWPDAKRDVERAAEHGPGVLDDEFSQQVTAYTNAEPWTRPRPAKPVKN